MSMTPKPQCRRCSRCDLNWPTSPETTYGHCPKCGRETWEHIDKPMDHGTAKSIVDAVAESKRKHEEFEAYYAEREAQRLAEDLEDYFGTAEPPKPPKRKRGRT